MRISKQEKIKHENPGLNVWLTFGARNGPHPLLSGLSRYRHQTGEVSWEEFLRLFELMDDGAEAEGAAVLNADLKEVLLQAIAGP